MPVRRRATALAVAAVLTGCGPSADDPGAEPVGLAPTFPVAPDGPGAPSTTSPTAAPVTGVGPTTPAVPATTTPGGPPASGGAVPTPAGPVLAATVRDAEGDQTASLDGAPPWADIVLGRLSLDDGGFELRVALGGGEAPTGSGSEDRTMNLASFYDVDGDGGIDFEVWANLADGGWDVSYFDNVGGTADFGGRSEVTLEVAGAEVVLRFPARHLAGASSFRWSLASEYGGYTSIGTMLAARDDAPDGDAPATFPG